MNDRIELKGIEVLARHGVLAHERFEAQIFRVDLSIYADLSPAAASDDLSDTVDYGRMAKETHDLVENESHQLLETLAHRIAEHVLTEPRVERVVVTVHKPGAPVPVKLGDVAVTIDRAR